MGQQLCNEDHMNRIQAPQLKYTTLFYTQDPLKNTRKYDPQKAHNKSRITHTVSLVRNEDGESFQPKQDSYKEDSYHDEDNNIGGRNQKQNEKNVQKNNNFHKKPKVHEEAYAKQQQNIIKDLKNFVVQDNSKIVVKDAHSKINLNPVRQKIIQMKKKQLGEFQHIVGSTDVPTGTNDNKYYTLSNNIVYKGQWLKSQQSLSSIHQNDKINGKGQYFLPDNSYLQAFAENNKINGYGRLININGDYYEGQFEDNKANGIGRYCEGEIVYNGGFKNNLPHGNGQEYTQLYVFIGEFQHGYRKKGKLTWKNKKDDDEEYIYEGSFINNMIKPSGKLKVNGEIIPHDMVHIK